MPITNRKLICGYETDHNINDIQIEWFNSTRHRLEAGTAYNITDTEQKHNDRKVWTATLEIRDLAVLDGAYIARLTRKTVPGCVSEDVQQMEQTKVIEDSGTTTDSSSVTDATTETATTTEGTAQITLTECIICIKPFCVGPSRTHLSRTKSVRIPDWQTQSDLHL